MKDGRPHTRAMEQIRPRGSKYREIAALFRRRIVNGEFLPGSRLPSLRDLKCNLRISHETALAAYLVLEREGVVESRPRQGFFVCRPSLLDAHFTSATGQLPEDPLLRVVAALQCAELFPFGFSAPSGDLLPERTLSRIVREVAVSTAGLYEYQGSPGLVNLRREIAKRAAFDGLHLSSEEIIITAGAMEALALALQAVTRPGGIVCTESPTHMNILAVVRGLHLTAVEIPTDPERGLDLGALERTLKRRKPQAIVVTPRFSNPLGVLMAEDSMEKLIGLAAKSAVPVIEDDVYGELYFSPSRPRSLKFFDTAGIVLSCSSFSKTVAPGLRVGWMIPGQYAPAVLRYQFSQSVGASTLSQRILAEFLASGGYERHLRRLRSRLHSHCSELRAGVQRLFPQGTVVSNPAGGLVLWVTLPEPVSTDDLFRAVQGKQAGFIPGSLFSTTGRFASSMRLSFGVPPTAVSERALRLLAKETARLNKANHVPS